MENGLIFTLSTEVFFELIGLTGFVFYMMAYGLLQLGRIDGNGQRYVVLNLVAALMVLISLVDQFNLASMLIQVSWVAISMIGLVRIWYNRRAKKTQKSVSRVVVI